MRPVFLPVIGLIAASVSACASGDGEAADDTAAAVQGMSEGGGAGVLGTIRANLDGTPRTSMSDPGCPRPYTSVEIARASR